MNLENVLSSSLLLRYGIAEHVELRMQTDIASSKEQDGLITSKIFGLGMNLQDGLSTFIEGFSYLNNESAPEHYVNTGLAYLITENLQIDLSAAGSLNSFSGSMLLNIGIAWKL